MRQLLRRKFVAKPGVFIEGRIRRLAGSFPNQHRVVGGFHFVQEDSPDAIGRAIAAGSNAFDGPVLGWPSGSAIPVGNPILAVAGSVVSIRTVLLVRDLSKSGAIQKAADGFIYLDPALSAVTSQPTSLLRRLLSDGWEHRNQTFKGVGSR